MSALAKLIKQCRKPSGLFGELVAIGMNTGHHKLTKWGLEHVSIEEDHVILDVGCGGGKTVHTLAGVAKKGRVYGIDYSEKSVSVSKRLNASLITAGRVEIRQGTVSNLPFPDNMFDLITAIETHYFWPDLSNDMMEVLRVLKPGGRLLITGESYMGSKYDERNKNWAKLGNMTNHTIDEFKELFISAGYSDVHVFEEYEQGWICGLGSKPA